MNTNEKKVDVPFETRALLMKVPGLTKPDVIQINAGVLVQLICAADKEKEVLDQVFNLVLEFHRKLPKGQDAYPFRIYTYRNNEEAFKSSGILRTRSHNYENGMPTTYFNAGDAVFKMREIDADALLYGVHMPFTFEVRCEVPEFEINEFTSYKELDVSGGHYGFESGKKTKTKLGWELTINSY